MKRFVSVFVILFCFVHSFNSSPMDTVVENEKVLTSPEEKDKILADISEDCLQPKEIGRCFALFHRFHFNAEHFICEEFIYGGCMGNKNNFETLENCERACLKKKTDKTDFESNDDVNEETNVSTTETVHIV